MLGGLVITSKSSVSDFVTWLIFLVMIRSTRQLRRIRIGLRRLKKMLELPVMGYKDWQALT